MHKSAQRRVAEEAARLMAEGIESEYLNAKRRAVDTLGLSDQTRLPSNRKIRAGIGQITKEQLGDGEMQRRIWEMRKIAEELMEHLDDCDPYLIGSTLTGEIRDGSDVDLHAYSDNHEAISERLRDYGYDQIEVELVENRKGTFVHLRWREGDFPVEITVYPWSWRHVVPISSVTGRPMKRVDIVELRKLLKKTSPLIEPLEEV
jgi:predicted nucleotidyltransferase